MSGTLAIKGIREGLLITLGGNTWAEALEEMLAHIDSKGDFFLGARIALQLGPLEPRAAELADARSRLAKRGLTLWAALTEAPAVVRSAKSLGLVTVLPAPPTTPDATKDAELGAGSAKLVRGALPSGHRIQGAGHVVILGNVDSGAEVVAAGNILVWGALLGRAQAGAGGDDSAVVCALDLSPEQLVIAGRTVGPPPHERSAGPSMARLDGERIVIEEWKSSDREIHTAAETN
jgi:septum site-determining protein MinC